jgi:hypothetical protein
MDIDIDCKTDMDPTKVFANATKASMLREQALVPHPCGVYFQDVPVDHLTKLSAIPYDEAEELGYFKIDFLHLSVYDHFNSREEIKELIEIDPDWGLLLIPSVVQKLAQVSKHLDLLTQVKPTSIIELADVLALIRPQKRYVLPLYLRDRSKARAILYTKESGETYGFKKGHAIAYAMVIVLQLHLIKAGII